MGRPSGRAFEYCEKAVRNKTPPDSCVPYRYTRVEYFDHGTTTSTLPACAHRAPVTRRKESRKSHQSSEYGSKRIIFDLLSLLGAAFAQSAVVVPHLVLGIVL